MTHVASCRQWNLQHYVRRALQHAAYIYMRTLLDLLNDEHGYVRIYRQQDGFGYELSTYVQRPMADLFERMTGYASIATAREAARSQLSAAKQVRRLSRKRRAY